MRHRALPSAQVCGVRERPTLQFCPSYLDEVMPRRIRHCLECPNCGTRYLIGLSPYGNGAYVVSSLAGQAEEHTLYCSCGRPGITCRWSDLGCYAVSNGAYDRGYGRPDEIVREQI